MEEWRIINNYPKYSISSYGNVKNNKSNLILKPELLRGYYAITLYNDKCRKHMCIHRLVGFHFLPNWNDYNEIDHINRIKTDNKFYNLRWINRSGNNRNKGKTINKTSKYIGVYYHKSSQRYVAQIRINGKKKHLGYFENEEEAGNKYIEYLKKI